LDNEASIRLFNEGATLLLNLQKSEEESDKSKLKAFSTQIHCREMNTL